MGMLLSRAAAVGIVALIACGEARAQGGPPNAVQGFSQNRDQPVRIEAASLEMHDRKKEATFAGNVKVVQGDTTMTSKTLVAFYEAKSAQPSAPAGSKGAPLQADKPGPNGSSSIRRLVAKGNVMVVRNDQVVTGETAVFDTRTNLITMLGGVLLTHCNNVVRGDRLLVDMTTGVSRVESDSNKVVVLAGQGQDCGNAPGGSKPPGLSVSPAKPK